MPISFGRKSNLPVGKAAEWLTSQSGKTAPFPSGQGWDAARFSGSKVPARLVDLRSPEQFRAGFIPGSYSVPDEHCWEAARQIGLFAGRQVYFLADNPEQLTLCEQFSELDQGSEFVGWFGTDALEEWRKAIIQTGQLEAISADTLAIRLAGWNTIVLDILDDGPVSAPVHTSALRFPLGELPLSLDGLPVETAVCITAGSLGVSSFASSLMWNFGFHKISYLLQSDSTEDIRTAFLRTPQV